MLAVNVGGRYRNMTFPRTDCDYNIFSIQGQVFQRKCPMVSTLMQKGRISMAPFKIQLQKGVIKQFF